MVCIIDGFMSGQLEDLRGDPDIVMQAVQRNLVDSH